MRRVYYEFDTDTPWNGDESRSIVATELVIRGVLYVISLSQHARGRQLACDRFPTQPEGNIMEEVTRRTAVRAGAGATAALLASGGMLVQSTEPAIAASGDLTAEDVSVSSDDGSLSSLTVTPDVTVEWDGQDSQVAEIQATWKVKTDGTSETTVGETPYKIAVDSPTTSGSIDHSFDEIDLLNALSASNFAASTDGTSKSTTVELSMDVDLMDSSSNKVDSANEVLGPTEYTVTVENTSSSTTLSVSASGTANTSGA